MKLSIYFTLLIFFVSGSAYAQSVTDTTFLDAYRHVCSKDSFSYMRIATPHKKVYDVKDYYKNGKLHMEGIFSSLEPEVKNGFFTEYYESGFKKSDGEYYNDKKRGIFHIYKDTLGYLWETATYKNDKLNGPFSVYAKNGLQYKGSFENGKLVKYDFGNAANLFSSQNINDTKNNQVSENRPKLSDILSRNYRKYASEKFRSTSSTVTLSYEVDSDGVLGNVSVESGDSTEQSEMVLNSLKEYCLGRGKDQGAKITGTLSVTFPQMNVRWNYKIGSNYNSMLYFSIDTNAKSSAKKNSQVSLATDIVSEKPRFVR